jgi:hypothetical protein
MAFIGERAAVDRGAKITARNGAMDRRGSSPMFVRDESTPEMPRGESPECDAISLRDVSRPLSDDDFRDIVEVFRILKRWRDERGNEK